MLTQTSHWTGFFLLFLTANRLYYVYNKQIFFILDWFLDEFKKYFYDFLDNFWTIFEHFFGHFFCKFYSDLPARLGSDWGTFCFIHWWTNFILNYFTFLWINSCTHCLWNFFNNIGTLLYSFGFWANFWWGRFTNLFLKIRIF